MRLRTPLTLSILILLAGPGQSRAEDTPDGSSAADERPAEPSDRRETEPPTILRRRTPMGPRSPWSFTIPLPGTGLEDELEFVVDASDGLLEDFPDQATRLRLLLNFDLRRHDSRAARDTGVRLDRALIGLDGFVNLVSWRLIADLRGTDTNDGLHEAWISAQAPWHDERLLRVTAGVIAVTPGMEASLPESTLPFADYAMPAFLNTRRGPGLRVDGELLDGLLSWDVAALFGEATDLAGERYAGPGLMAKVVSYPFRQIDSALDIGGWHIPLLSGLHVSAALGFVQDVRRDIEVSNSLRERLYTTPRLEADQERFRHLGYGLDLGPIRIIHEFTRGTLLGLKVRDAPPGRNQVRLSGSAVRRVDLEQELHGWSIGLSINLTGEAYDSRPFRQRYAAYAPVRRPIDDGGIGRIEVALRYANSDIARELNDNGVTTERISAQEFRTFDAALNWSPLRSVRLTLQVTRTLADGEPQALGGQGRATAGLLRLQISF